MMELRPTSPLRPSLDALTATLPTPIRMIDPRINCYM